MTGPRPLFTPAPDPLAEPLAEIAADLTAPPAPAPEIPDIPDDEPLAPFSDRVRAAHTQPTTRSETSIVAEMLAWVAVQPGAHGRKVHSSGVTGSGEPDLLICWRGRMVVVEVKRPGERPTRVQLRRLLIWQDAGALVGWATGLEDLRSILAHADDWSYRQDLTTPGATPLPPRG